MNKIYSINQHLAGLAINKTILAKIDMNNLEELNIERTDSGTPFENLPAGIYNVILTPKDNFESGPLVFTPDAKFPATLTVYRENDNAILVISVFEATYGIFLRYRKYTWLEDSWQFLPDSSVDISDQISSLESSVSDHESRIQNLEQSGGGPGGYDDSELRSSIHNLESRIAALEGGESV